MPAVSHSTHGTLDRCSIQTASESLAEGRLVRNTNTGVMLQLKSEVVAVAHDA